MRRHPAEIDAALGAQSSGAAGLTTLIDAAEEAVSTSRLTVERQHVVFQVVLRKFVEDVPPHGRVVARVNLANKGRRSQIHQARYLDIGSYTAAQRLHLHVNTACYRLERIAERTGYDLRRLTDVVELLIAVRLLGAAPPTTARTS